MENKKNKKQPDDEKINEPDLAVVSGGNNERKGSFLDDTQQILIKFFGIPRK